MKKIIDVCCGGRMFRFDKQNKDVIFMDHRIMVKGSIKQRLEFEVNPDVVGSYTNIPYPDKSFKIIVMDPPHLQKVGETSRMAKKYGKLGIEWKRDIKKGFEECMRCLEDYGILIFKRNEYDIPLQEIIRVFPQKPMIGQRTGKNNNTVRLIFYK